MSTAQETNPPSAARWSIGGVLVEAIAERDFDKLAGALSPDVQFRAMLPRGPLELEGASTVAERFAFWFGSAEEFEVVDAAVGEVGGRLHLSWRLRVRPAPNDIGDGWHVIEQQLYADATEAIDRLDLLCSGFHPERAADRA